MKSCVYILIILSFLVQSVQAQRIARDMRPYNEDSLRAILAVESVDTVRVELFAQLHESYFFKEPDSSLKYGKKTLELSREIGYTTGILQGLRAVAEAHRILSNFNEALKTQFELLKFSEENREIDYETAANGFIGVDYFELEQFDQAVSRLSKAVIMSKPIHHKLTRGRKTLFNIYLARAYNAINRTDSAFYYLNEAYRVNPNPKIQLSVLRTFSVGDVYLRIDNKDSAKFYYKLALKLAQEDPKEVPSHISTTSSKLASIYDSENQTDSSLYFVRNAYRIAISKNMKLRILEATSLLSKLHRKTGKLDSALYYRDIKDAVYDSLYGKDKTIELQLLLFQEQQRIQDAQRAEERYRNTILLIGLVSITMVILIASILLFRGNRIKHKTNLALQKTLTELKSTQAQLIQSEKMASLGELTAGIAHEIQNPLNFVNNFSELNKELIGELKNEVERKNLEEIKSIAINIEDNEAKIHHHGQRADAIVKSMLQHSRANSGKKELTDINIICDEYLRIAYHGMRAKNKSADVKVDTRFDPSVSKVSVVPQDVGRAILNLINNALYAVTEKTNTSSIGYTPTIKISTKQLGGKIEIHVEDNGTGIPDSIKEKIFQPFFTSKPAGQGTGLGLSLTYDIVKAHGGTLEVNSKEGSGAKFIIQLPI
jgi:two-component system NtrC family sensor kinase